MNTIDLSIVIVNFNGSKYLVPLLKSILASKIKNYEIVVVDNGSMIRDLSEVDLYISTAKNIKLIKLHKNYGPACARNIGVKNSSGQYLSFLDNDTLVDKNWANEALKYFKIHKKVGVIQCKLLLESDHQKIDYVGEYLGSNGFLVQECPAGQKDIGQFNKSKKILAAKSAGMFIRRKTFDLAGGFDDDYFIYVEETDLGWRSWLVGYEVHFLPTSIVYHHFGTSTLILGQENASNLAKFHGPKNYITTLIKNLSLPSLVRVLPIHVFLWLGLSTYRLLSFKPLDTIYMVGGILWPLFNLNRIIKNRTLINKRRIREDSYIFKHLVVNRSIFYFINKATKRTTIGNAKSY